ncbi:DUF7146 domain-containing protein [Pseudoprimorskyibacter insulae]|uniref:Uncharacterized protein n=1 Tax=Pseudoprimorskyibacter insulae TaxID=1695997 RepID=A0A2R8AZ70_9RHOB|nr:toprim domain-containing protein [Pseudoprimorskyibacter insulae]SPF81139.1 hypothetical protein PRI8871_02959 [Pseudoprimorskyibacter insulae]
MDARTLTQTLKGHWYGRYGTAPCPVCQPEQRKGQNALTLSEGQAGLLAHCKKSNCGFSDILGAAHVAPGLWTPPDPATRAKANTAKQADAKRRADQAFRLWQEAEPITGTIAETYLRGRGITCDLPETLRFHPECWHGATARRYPAMVALVEGCKSFGIHRTYLRPDGASKADIAPCKAMLGATSGGAVRLTDQPGPLVVAEGIETGLSLASGLLSLRATIWSALSTSGMRGLFLHSGKGRLKIASDGDAAGREAAQALAMRAHSLGWQVSMLPAPNGRDWNDVLMMKGGK